MPNENPHPYPVVEMVINSIADWVTQYRSTAGHDTSLSRCDSNEVMAMAQDLGLSSGDLRALAERGPHAADLVHKLLGALGVDSAALSDKDPLVMRDLQRLCSTCQDKGRCSHELADGTAAAHFHEFCPNSFTIDALLADKNKTASVNG